MSDRGCIRMSLDGGETWGAPYCGPGGSDGPGRTGYDGRGNDNGNDNGNGNGGGHWTQDAGGNGNGYRFVSAEEAEATRKREQQREAEQRQRQAEQQAIQSLVNQSTSTRGLVNAAAAEASITPESLKTIDSLGNFTEAAQLGTELRDAKAHLVAVLNDKCMLENWGAFHAPDNPIGRSNTPSMVKLRARGPHSFNAVLQEANADCVAARQAKQAIEQRIEQVATTLLAQQQAKVQRVADMAAAAEAKRVAEAMEAQKNLLDAQKQASTQASTSGAVQIKATQSKSGINNNSAHGEIKPALAWLEMAWRSYKGDKCPDVLAWQQQNRVKAPSVAAASDAVQSSKAKKVAEGLYNGANNRIIGAVKFAAEEAARKRLGEQTKTWTVMKTAGTFAGEEAARFKLHKTTETMQFANKVGDFVKTDIARFSLGKQTVTGTAVAAGFVKLSQMSAEELSYNLGAVVGDMFLGFGAAKAFGLANAAIPRITNNGMNVAIDFAEAHSLRSPLVIQFETGKTKGVTFMHNGIKPPVDITLRNPVVNKVKLNTGGGSVSSIKISIPQDRAGHIFKNKDGHMADTAQNRKLLVDAAYNSNNFKGVDKWGNTWHSQLQLDGSEIWTQSRGGRIINGGINNPPKKWHPETGYSLSNKPTQPKS